ncbi:MAG: protein kinase [Planctomycetes bacterium]|nr:protein kinase [Planctomycetota bacterium]
MAKGPNQDDPFIGRQFGACRIESKIAVGGYGMVYKAVDLNLGIPRAVKFFHPHLSSEKGFRERFYNEMQLLAKMDHPNIVKIIYGIDEPDISGFVMEYVQGKDLADTLDAEGCFEVERAREIFLQVGRAIQYAHTLQPPVIHRDLAPDNAMIRPDGTVKIMDFGISKTINAERLTQTGIVLGKPMYMAPEQFEGKVTELCDQYALGIILYEMVVGQVPFEGDTPIAQYRARYRQEVQFPPESKENLTPEIEQAVLKATSRDPKSRFADVASFLRSIERPAARARPAIPAPLAAVPEAEGEADVLEEARMKMGLRRFREAVLDLDRLLAARPDHQEARALRDECRKEMEAREAERALEEARREALSSYKKGDVESAREQVEVFLACLEKLPRSKSHVRLKRDLARQIPGLVDEVEAREKERRETVRELLNEARRLYRAKDQEGAVGVLEDLRSLDPANSEAAELLALCRKAGRLHEVNAHYKEGLERLRAEEYAAAIAAFDEVLATFPDHADAARYRDLAQAQLDEQEAEAERREQRGEEIQKTLEQARRHLKNWEYGDAIRCSRMILSLVEDHREAKEILDESRRRMEDSDKVAEISLLYNEGLSFYQNRKYKEAATCFDKVLECFEQHKGAAKYRELAVTAIANERRIAELNREGIEDFRNSRYTKAVALFEQVLALDRTNQIARKYATLCQEMAKAQND